MHLFLVSLVRTCARFLVDKPGDFADVDLPMTSILLVSVAGVACNEIYL